MRVMIVVLLIAFFGVTLGTNYYVKRLGKRVDELERRRNIYKKQFEELNTQLQLYRRFVKKLAGTDKVLPPLETSARFFDLYSSSLVQAVAGVEPRVTFEGKAARGIEKAASPLWFLETSSVGGVVINVAFDAGETSAPAAVVETILDALYALRWVVMIEELTIKKTIVKIKCRISGRRE